MTLGKAIQMLTMKRGKRGVTASGLMISRRACEYESERKHCITISDLYIEFPEVLKPTLFRIVTGTLGYCKLCA